jgi:hypothetical protein
VRALASFALAVTLPACFYQYDAPLGTPSGASLDPKLLGKWRCVAAGEEKAALISFHAFDEKQYSVILDAEGDKPSAVRAFTTPVAQLLNVQDVDEREAAGRKWGLARYRLIGTGALVIELLKDDALAGVAPAAAVETLRKKLDSPVLYDSFVACARAEKTDAPKP